MKQLIINADDFGIHEKVNAGIVQGYNEGCITSATIMAGGAAFEDAVCLALNNPGLGVGVHLTLVGEYPVLDPGKIYSLVNEQEMFVENYNQFLRRYFYGQVDMQHIRAELTAQIEKVREAGITITHIDSHQHLHVLPGIIDIVLDVAKEFSIKALRIPDESILFFGGYPFKAVRFLARGGLTCFARLARYKAVRRGMIVPDHFYGMLAGGNMCEAYLANIVAQLAHGISEIMMHPGTDNHVLTGSYNWCYNWQEELQAVISRTLIDDIAKRHIKLISFREIQNE